MKILKRKSYQVLKSGMLFILSLSLLSIFILLASCDDYPADVKGDVTSNTTPIVEFANVPADDDTFSYA
ncbi:MAG: hypothetical protein P9M15_01575, partial [Candidatus Electryoneaceae bacterium]|nr:hypothetical protein [Candidatus Electryoneaceae bacterium]